MTSHPKIGNEAAALNLLADAASSAAGTRLPLSVRYDAARAAWDVVRAWQASDPAAMGRCTLHDGAPDHEDPYARGVTSECNFSRHRACPDPARCHCPCGHIGSFAPSTKETQP